jgi:hypothetical protein
METVKIAKSDIDTAVNQGIISTEQWSLLWNFFNTTSDPRSAKFSFVNILYYLGGGIAIGAMSFFLGIAWESFGDLAWFIIATLYLFVAFGLADSLKKRSYIIPAWIFATMGVALIPIVIYAIQKVTGLWYEPVSYHAYHVYMDGKWLIMEIWTLIWACVAFSRYRYPFMLMPVVITLWYMSMDIGDYLFFRDISRDSYIAGYEIKRNISFIFGILLIIWSLTIDIYTKRKPDFWFWLALFWTITFWWSLSLTHFGSILYCIINIGFLILGMIVLRRTFVIFGTLGIFCYIAYLSYDVFERSLLFPFVLSWIGIGIIFVGIYFKKMETKAEVIFAKLFPTFREFRE